ncbi:MAG: hypothetical protein KTR31_04855 [Myxococcales bacterium]|nr:hypothetical protein [Myxococcales bacterium]
MNLSPRIGFLLVAAACTGQVAPVDQAPPDDTNTEDEPNVLPIDTSFFVPEDTAPNNPPDLQPSDWITLRHVGTWQLSGNPFSDLAGTLVLREYLNQIDTSDTAMPPEYVCDVTYALTGTAVDVHTCSSCDFVFAVEHYVSTGNPGACREPDAPQNGAVWQLGYNSKEQKIYHNYFGTDVWLPWYDTLTAPPNLDFEWNFTLATEVEDTADMN